MGIRAWGPLFALLALLAAGLTGVALQYSKPHNEGEPAKVEERNSPIAKPIAQVTTDQGDTKGKDKRAWSESLLEKPTDTLLVFFNGLLALYTWRLYRATSGLFTETAGLREAAENQRIDSLRSIAASELAAKAAQASAEALPIIEGAYVYPVIAGENVAESLSAFQHPDVRTNRLRINFYFKNFGKTPVNILLYRAHLIHLDGPNLRATNMVRFQLVQRATLGAVDHTEPLETEIADFSREEWGSVMSAGSRLYFAGEIRYADIWGNIWQFSFNWEYSPAHGRLVPDNQARINTE
jgi:hypothetical protein